MRIHDLTEQKELPADAILIHMGVVKEEREVILELLPLIPLALWGAGAAWTAYDTYQNKKALDRGEITQAEFAQRVGTDVAIGVAGGVAFKAAAGVGKFAWKAGKKVFAKGADDAVGAGSDVATSLAKKMEIPKTNINVAAITARNTDNVAAKFTSKADNLATKATTNVVNKTTKKLTPAQQNALSNMPPAAPITKIVNKTINKTTKKLTPAQQNALSNMPAAAPLAGKAGAKLVGKKADDAARAAKKKADDVKKKADDTKKKKKGKGKWGWGGSNTKSYFDVDLDKLQKHNKF